MMNKKLFPTILLIIWALSVLFYFGNSLVEVTDLYNNKQIILLSRNLSWFFLSAIIVVLLSAGVLAFYTKSILKIAILAITSTALFYYAYSSSAGILSDFRTYSYEILIVSFFFWGALILSIFCASIIFYKSYKKLLMIALLVTVSAIVIFIFEGRGSVEHINLLIGGLMVEQSWKMFSKSATQNILYFMVIATIAWSVIYITAYWVRNGKFYIKTIAHNLKMLVVFVFLMSLTLISIPVGGYLNKHDIKNAEKFIAELIQRVNVYYEEKGEYPRDINDLEGGLPDEAPRLLDIFQYLANDYKGAYYFSRPQKYCFVFQDPGKDFGYYSITNERQWRFSKVNSSLEEQLFSVCDDGGPRSHENLIAGHLGVSEFSNPIDELAMELNQDVRIEQSKLSTEMLQKEIDSLGVKDPSIYGDAKPTQEIPQHALERTIDDLRFSIMTGELEDIEPFSVKEFENIGDSNSSPEKKK